MCSSSGILNVKNILRMLRMFRRKRNRLYPRGTAVCEVLATANENGSQITCYAANNDWLFMTCYILEPIIYREFRSTLGVARSSETAVYLHDRL